MTDYSHLHENFRHLTALPMEERIAALDEPRWIGYPKAADILKLLESLLTTPKRPRMPNVLIVGDSNNGKTTLIRRFYELHGKTHGEDIDNAIKPIILAEAPSTADEKSLYISILERFFTPYRATDATSKLRYQVIHLMRVCQVRMLIIDELHSFLTGTALKQREVMNAIKLLCNELCIPIIGVGTREAVQILHTDPQHASRFDVISLPVWNLDSEFQRLLLSFEKILPLKKPSELKKPELANRLYAISEGNFGNLHRLLVECAKGAIRSSKEHIDSEIIMENQWIRPTHGIRERFK